MHRSIDPSIHWLVVQTPSRERSGPAPWTGPRCCCRCSTCPCWTTSWSSSSPRASRRCVAGVLSNVGDVNDGIGRSIDSLVLTSNTAQVFIFCVNKREVVQEYMARSKWPSSVAVRIGLRGWVSFRCLCVRILIGPIPINPPAAVHQLGQVHGRGRRAA